MIWMICQKQNMLPQSSWVGTTTAPSRLCLGGPMQHRGHSGDGSFVSQRLAAKWGVGVFRLLSWGALGMLGMLRQDTSLRSINATWLHESVHGWWWNEWHAEEDNLNHMKIQFLCLSIVVHFWLWCHFPTWNTQPVWEGSHRGCQAVQRYRDLAKMLESPGRPRDLELHP